MLAGLVALYLAASIAVGLYAATRVRGASDFAVAGRQFGATIVAALVLFRHRGNAVRLLSRTERALGT